MIAVNGYHQTWEKRAAHNLRTQIPGIAAEFPEITAYHPATINVRFESIIIFAGYDHRTSPIQWEGGTEVFDFVRVLLSFPSLKQEVKALCYVAHNSRHRLDPHKHEFLAPQISGLSDRMPITTKCDRHSVRKAADLRGEELVFM